MNSSCDYRYKLSKNVTYKVNKHTEAVFLQPDMSIARVFAVSKETAKILKYLRIHLVDFDMLCTRFKVASHERKDLRCLLRTLIKYNLIEQCTVDESTKAELLNDRQRVRFASNLVFFSSYENTGMNRYEMQRRLSCAHVIILGLGGIGSVVFDGLVRAGVGQISVIDHDRVELRNLSRQILFTLRDINKYKVDVAAEHAKRIDPSIRVTKHKIMISETAKLDRVGNGVDLIIICADEPSMERLTDIISRYCMKKRTPFIVGGGYSAHTGGLPRTIIPGETTCWRCYKKYIRKNLNQGIKWTPDILPTGGSLSAISGIVGSMVSLEAIKVLTRFSCPSHINTIGDISLANLKIMVRNVTSEQTCRSCNKKSIKTKNNFSRI